MSRKGAVLVRSVRSKGWRKTALTKGGKQKLLLHVKLPYSSITLRTGVYLLGMYEQYAVVRAELSNVFPCMI